ncbi:MAG: NAD(P)-dependent glycerol-3-phosphate dehydrogenase [SAR324 cluster bacterium]|nr:NAD(P)-dependent glycerol-3-phosphate dehydrogenase [SAR324 cluster bacterium]
MDIEKIGVIGGGAWGTALASLMANKGYDVTLWAYEKETVDAINQKHENTVFLPGIPLPESLKASNDMAHVVKNHQFLISSPPSHVARTIARQLRPHIRKDHVIIIVSKGVELSTLSLMSDVYAQELENIPTVSVLSGPTFAEDVARGMPTGAVLACKNEEIAKSLQQILKVPHFRVYLSDDLAGVQIGGTVKNVIAIATGISDGMGLGLSARSAMICRGLAEMNRLGLVLGGKLETFAGMSGLGDLVLTATGTLSRNYSLGHALGSGQSLEEYMSKKRSVAEGVVNAKSIKGLAEKYQVDMPISSAVYDILYEGLTPRHALQRLLERELPSREFEQINS